MRSLHFILAFLLTAAAWAQVSFTGGGYVQDFGSLPGTTNNTLNVPWTDNVTIPGWYSTKTSYSVTDGTLGGSAAAFDSTSTTAQNVGLFSFGAAGSADRALGMRSTASFAGNTPIHVGVRLVNNTAQTITRVSFAYTGEQWFKSSTANNTFTLTSTYQIGATSLTTGTWLTTGATFTAPVVSGSTATALDGNAAANRRGVAGSIGGLSWAPGQELWIRITDTDQAGDEHGLAIDDFAFWADADTALFFNGTTNYVTMTGTAALGASALTLECWFFRTGAGAAASTGSGGVSAIPLVTKGRGESDGSNLDCNYFLGIDAATNTLAADFEAAPAAGITAGQNYPAKSTTTLPFNQWTHVAATYDPAAIDGQKWKLFINGVQDVNTLANPPANAAPRADSIQHFGVGTAMNSTGVASGFFQGAIDEVRVWNIARTPAEIANARGRQITVPVAGLLARYGFGEAAGIIAGSSVPTAPNGALIGSPVWVSGPGFAANVAPTVALTAPASGGSAQEPASVAFAATAGDTDGAVAKVEFFANGTKVGEDATAPYAFTWAGVAAGSYSLTARATDDRGATMDSAPVTYAVTVNPNATPAITALAPAANAVNLTSPVTLQVSLADGENDPLTVKFFGRRATPAPGPDFTLVTLPDTQFYSENLGGTRAAIYHSQTQWIVDQRVARNIAFVSHMGDVVQTGDNGGNPIEWLVADAAMARIEDNAATLTAYGIPWGGAPGNHDFSPVGDQAGTSVFFNQYFGVSRFAGRTYYGGRYGTTNNNNYELFSASGLDFIIIHLAYRTTPDLAVIDWADALMKSYPNRRAIVTSHWVVNTGNPASWGGAAQTFYEQLKDNPNFFMMLCGHIHGEGQRTDVFEGRAVHSLLQDYQGRANGGDGWLRYYEFSPATNTIRARTYSTTLQQSETDADSEFTLPYDMQSAMGPWVELTSVNVAGGSAGTSYPWPGIEVGKDYEWYASATDGIHTASTAVRRFTVRADAPPTVALTAPANDAVFAQPASIALTANAADTDGTVARVEFYRGSTKLGEDTTAPFAFIWSGPAAGSYSLTAIARDAAGNATLSTPVNVTVNSSGTLTRGPYLNQGNDSSIVIRWRSSAAVVGRVRYGTSVALLDQSTDEAAATTEHVVKLNGLSAYTRYYYSVGSPTDTLGGGDSGHTFRTSPTPGIATDTRIWVLGDCGRANANQASVRDAYYGWTGSRTPDLCLMLGDNAYNSGTQTEYDAAVFAMYPTFLRKMPLWSCLGNHDANNGSTSPTANFPYFDMFTFPTNGECGGVVSGTERYFSFDYGNIHFINLDSQTSDRSTNGPMATWLQTDLASTTKTWIVAFFHHPPYSKGSHNSDTETQLIQMRTNFGPILEAGGVDLVLTGHSHCYERSFFLDGHYDVSTTFTNTFKKQPGNGRPAGDGAYLKPLTGPRDHFGAVYTLTGSAGSADGGALNHPAMYVSYNTLGSFNLDINGTQLNATYIEAGGAVTDSFTILKEGAADSDSDGIPDAYEIAHGLDRHDPADALLDKDGDGVSNRDEWVLGLLASTPDRYDWSVARTGPNVTVTCPTLPGRTYRVWFSSDLTTWIPGSAAVAGTGGNFVWIDDGTVTGNGSSRFYRVRVTLP